MKKKKYFFRFSKLDFLNCFRQIETECERDILRVGHTEREKETKTDTDRQTLREAGSERD